MLLLTSSPIISNFVDLYLLFSYTVLTGVATAAINKQLGFSEQTP